MNGVCLGAYLGCGTLGNIAGSLLCLDRDSCFWGICVDSIGIEQGESYLFPEHIMIAKKALSI